MSVEPTQEKGKKKEDNMDFFVQASKIVDIEGTFNSNIESTEEEIKLLKDLYEEVYDNFKYVSKICKEKKVKDDKEKTDILNLNETSSSNKEKKPWNALYNILEQMLNIRKLIFDHLKEKTNISKQRLDFTLKEYNILLKKFLKENSSSEEEARQFFSEFVNLLNNNEEFSFDNGNFENTGEEEEEEDIDEEKLLKERLEKEEKKEKELKKKEKKEAKRKKRERLLEKNEVVLNRKTKKPYLLYKDGTFKKIKFSLKPYFEIMYISDVPYRSDTGEEIEFKKIKKSLLRK